jgi:hypothetical protein
MQRVLGEDATSSSDISYPKRFLNALVFLLAFLAETQSSALAQVDRVRDLQKSTSSYFSSSRLYFYVISFPHNTFYSIQFLQYQPWCQSRPGAV